MYRKPLFWILFVAVSLACVAFTFRYFSQGFPIVTLDLRMDRETALNFAETLAEEHSWGPEEFSQAASFGLDYRTQVFVELEAGGTAAFGEMLKGDLYAPYTWCVRHFKQGETTETSLWFTPAGQPYGFFETLPEDQPGASLSSEDALAIAEAEAGEKWNLQLAEFDLVEPKQEVRPGGRVDHTFVYERRNVNLGEGRYRLRLTVAGDRLTGLQHFVKIPEAFSRRNQEMRSANDTIAFGATIAMLGLYVFGGCIVGLFFLLRQHWVIWRQPVFWAFLIAFLQFLVGVNHLPLAWMGYDTAISSESFLFQQIAWNLFASLGLGALLALSFMAAEGLSRKAFPQHIQLWKLWTGEVAGTKSVLGRTAAGYLLVALFFAYEVVLYFFSTSTLGWWSPSDALFHPDALATYFPWLDSIANSAQAGFWEECLFRAVPIAGAAVLGQRFGKRKAWIVGALVLQAVIFGAAHANYPAQPAYARLVELIIPSLAFGLLYLFFGLLPAIVLHFAFDVVWFALPLFVSKAPGVWVDQILVIGLALIPLWVVLAARLRAGRWRTVEDRILNRSWKRPERALDEEVPSIPIEAVEPVSGPTPLVRWLVLAGGLIGFIVWIFASKFSADVPPLTVTRAEVESSARALLEEKGLKLESPWRLLSLVEAPLNENDRFVWREGGPEAYRTLMGTYLGPPIWKARFARFEGDVAERAEEYEVWFDGSGTAIRTVHTLPEARPGATLGEEEARELAESTIRDQFGLDPAELTFVASEPSKLTARQDWSFTFSNPEAYPLSLGEARISVQIAGSEVVDAYRFVYVPEEWEREERNKRSMLDIFQFACAGVLALLVFAGTVGAVVSWSRRKFALGAFLAAFVLLFAASSIQYVNNWPVFMARLMTALPFKHQILMLIVGGVFGTLVVSATIAIVVGMLHNWNGSRARLRLQTGLLTGLALGGIALGLEAVTSLFTSQSLPRWPSFGPASSYSAVLAAGIAPISAFLRSTVLLLLAVGFVTRISAGLRNGTVIRLLSFVVLGVFLAGASGIESISGWLAAGTVSGILLAVVYNYVLADCWEAVPVAIGTLTVFSLIQQAAFHAYPGAVVGSGIGIIIVSVLAVFWERSLR
ncbi:MAG TPA: hypothetical protein VMY18_01780 [Acidobacteriota bacterium]|nr:hypothetical protein [Acidobacteriota bacterium]